MRSCTSLHSLPLCLTPSGNFSLLNSLALCGWRQVLDVSLSAVAKYCPNLTSINLSRCPAITDRALYIIAEHYAKRLVHLHLAETAITDAGVTQGCARCSALEELVLRKCEKLSEVALFAISTGCPALRVVDCAEVSGVTDRGYLHSLSVRTCLICSVQHLIQSCQKLEKLDLRSCRNVTVEFTHEHLRHVNGALTILLDPEKEFLPPHLHVQ